MISHVHIYSIILVLEHNGHHGEEMGIIPSGSWQVRGGAIPLFGELSPSGGHLGVGALRTW